MSSSNNYVLKLVEKLMSARGGGGGIFDQNLTKADKGGGEGVNFYQILADVICEPSLILRKQRTRFPVLLGKNHF